MAILIDSEDKSAFYFGCRAKRFLTLGALGRDEKQWDDYHRDYRRRSLEFVSCLISPRDERFTYDLRFLTQPDSRFFIRGKLTMALLCKARGISEGDAQISADHLLRLVESYFEEFDFERVTPDEIPGLIRPFETAHLVALTRRTSWHALDSIGGGTSGVPVGFQVQIGQTRPRTDSTKVFHVFPYVCSFSRFNSLFKLLLHQDAPIALSCRLRPTSLTPQEEEFFEQQIFLCEKHAQVSLQENLRDLASLRPTLQEQARVHQHLLVRMLHGLKDAAALLNVQVASSGQISQSLIDAFGHALSEPAGIASAEKDGSAGRHLSGGYEVVELSENLEARSAFNRLDVYRSPHEGTPPAAERLLHLFDASQAAMALRFPPATADPPVGVEARRWRILPPPARLPEVGLHVAKSVTGGEPQPIRISPEDRLRHIYIVGQTGTGKTTMLQTMIQSDIRDGRGVCVIDPHGDLFRKIITAMPKERLDDVVILDPADVEFPVGLNVLACRDETERHMVVHNIVGVIQRLLEDEYGGQAAGMAGPIFYQHMRMNLLLVMSDPDQPGTLLDFYRVFMDKGYWKRWVPLKIHDPQLELWVENSLSRAQYLTVPSDNVPLGQWIASKFEEFVFDPRLRNMFGQRQSTINIREIMDSGKILLVNLAKGELSAVAARFLGMIVLAELQRAAMSRVNLPLESRRPFFVYVDEFQSLATLNFVTMLSEGRKFGLGMVLANQFIGQVENKRIVDSIFGNVGTLVCFRLGQVDAEFLEKYVKPAFSQSDLTNLPNWISTMSTLINGQTVPPFSVETTLIHTPFDAQRAEEVKIRSREKYARPRTVVEEELGYSPKGDEQARLKDLQNTRD